MVQDPSVTRARPEVWIVGELQTDLAGSEQAPAEGFAVETIPDGPRLRERLRRVTPPDVLVIGLHGPPAVDLCRALRADPATAALPILVLTAPLGDAEIAAGLAAGADDYLVEPFGVSLLNQRIGLLLRAVAPEAARARAEQLAAELRTLHAAVLERQHEFEQYLLGAVGHDLRGPLSVILLGAQLLGDQPDASTRDIAQRIQSAAEQSARTIHDLLDFTQIRLGGGIPLDPRAMDLCVPARIAIDEARETHPRCLIELTSEGATEGTWDAERMAQVITSLVGNAIRYGTAGTPVTVHVADRGAQVELSVHHQGAISPEQLAHVFHPLQRVIDRYDRREPEPGLGLRLYIVATIVKAHRGTLAVTSTAEAGTTFVARLPRHAGALPPAA